MCKKTTLKGLCNSTVHSMLNAMEWKGEGDWGRYLFAYVHINDIMYRNKGCFRKMVEIGTGVLSYDVTTQKDATLVRLHSHGPNHKR